MLKNLYRLTKPGLVWGNLITTLAGALFASHWNISLNILFATLAGAACVVASACVFNNIYDRHADAKMPRTQNRALVSGAISPRSAALFGGALAVVGFSLLLFVGLLPALVALFGFLVYVCLYTPFKYRSHWGAVVGSLSGATPIVIGYSAVHSLDLSALILFAAMVAWQMPHFYAIALFRKDDYAQANIPVLSIAKGEQTAYIHILVYIVLFAAVADSLWLLHGVGFIYPLVTTLLSLRWFSLAISGMRAPSDTKRARRVFFMSLIVMVAFSFLLSFATFLP